MTKKKEIYIVEEDFQHIHNNIKEEGIDYRYPVVITIDKALEVIKRQMIVSNLRPRTISDYELHVTNFSRKMKIKYLDEVNTKSIYAWLESMEVAPQTKLIRLKCLKAFLSKCMDNGWIRERFWKKINIKVDAKVKEAASAKEVRILLSLLDMKNFVQLRDATAVLLIYRSGIRMNSLSQLKENHIDFHQRLLKLDGDITKNHQEIILPFDDTLNDLLRALVNHNKKIRREYGVLNDFIFITKTGTTIMANESNNIIQKNLYRYPKVYGLKNINGHSLRRAFAKNLLKRGANVAIISRALGHANLGITSRYLRLDKEELANALRRFL